VSEFIAERIWPGARIEQSIFGTANPEEIWRLVRAVCPDAVDCFAFEVSVGALFGLLLRHDSRVALKFHLERNAQALEAVQHVQGHVFDLGFPCPQPLGVHGRATLERWCDEGVYRDAHDPAVRRVIAEHLALLVHLAGTLQPLAGLEPSFPSVHSPLWPMPHNVLFDFDATGLGAEWIDEIARAAKSLQDAGVGELAIGHADWSVKHFRFDGLRPTVIYDWDSISSDYETIFVGGAAANFTYTEHVPVAPWPTVREAKAFLDEYEQARGRPFSTEERRAAQAAAVYSRAYSARCTHAVGKNAHEVSLEEYAEAFL
jgi:hypothetical protein